MHVPVVTESRIGTEFRHGVTEVFHLHRGRFARD